MEEVKPDAYYAFKDWLRLIDDGWPVGNATNTIFDDYQIEGLERLLLESQMFKVVRDRIGGIGK